MKQILLTYKVSTFEDCSNYITQSVVSDLDNNEALEKMATEE